MSYSVDRDGQTYRACVAHRGGKAISLTTNYGTAATPAPVPRVEAPVATAQDVPLRVGNTDAQRDEKLSAMRALDSALLSGKGMTLVRRMNVGEACAADGTISGDTKWKGTATSIQYEARLDGQALQVCINHKGGKPTGQVTGSALRP
jgi:anti-sigma-K factor RskA